MRIALIGATGFVGSRILTEALERGHETGLAATYQFDPVLVPEPETALLRFRAWRDSRWPAVVAYACAKRSPACTLAHTAGRGARPCPGASLPGLIGLSATVLRRDAIVPPTLRPLSLAPRHVAALPPVFVGAATAREINWLK
jgi:hypothetical protein